MVDPVAGELLLERASWPWIFYLNLPVGELAALVFALSMREEVPHEERAIDFLGAALLTAAVLLVLGAVQTFDDGVSLLGGLGLVVGALLVVAFVAVERRAEDPVMPLGLFTDAAISTGALAGIFLGGVRFSITAYTPVVVTGVFGMPPIAIAGALVPMAFAWSAGSFLGGRIILRLGYRTAVRVDGLLPRRRHRRRRAYPAPRGFWAPRRLVGLPRQRVWPLRANPQRGRAGAGSVGAAGGRPPRSSSLRAP